MDGRLHCAVSNGALRDEVHQEREVAIKDGSGLGGSHSWECHSVGSECSQDADPSRSTVGEKKEGLHSPMGSSTGTRDFKKLSQKITWFSWIS